MLEKMLIDLEEKYTSKSIVIDLLSPTISDYDKGIIKGKLELIKEIMRTIEEGRRHETDPFRRR